MRHSTLVFALALRCFLVAIFASTGFAYGIPSTQTTSSSTSSSTKSVASTGRLPSSTLLPSSSLSVPTGLPPRPSQTEDSSLTSATADSAATGSLRSRTSDITPNSKSAYTSVNNGSTSVEHPSSSLTPYPVSGISTAHAGRSSEGAFRKSSAAASGDVSRSFPVVEHVRSGYAPSSYGNTRPQGTGAFRISGSPTGTAATRHSLLPSGGPTQSSNSSLSATSGRNASATCGQCRVFMPEVRILYFPEQKTGACANGDTPASNTASGTLGPTSKASGAPGAPSITPAPSKALVRRRLNETGAVGYSVGDDGYTYVSGSVYVEMISGVSVKDGCGDLGKKFAQTRIALPPDVLSTISYDIPIGHRLTADAGAAQYTKALNLHDLACPTWGLSGSWTPDGAAFDPYISPQGDPLDFSQPPPVTVNGKVSIPPMSLVQITVSVGAPWYPIVALPTQVLSLDPAWNRCYNNLENAQFYVFDPPKTIMPQASMGADPTTPVAPPAVAAQSTKSPVALADQLPSSVPAAPNSGNAPVNNPAQGSTPANPAAPAPVANPVNPDPASTAAIAPAFSQAMAGGVHAEAPGVKSPEPNLGAPVADAPAANPTPNANQPVAAGSGSGSGSGNTPAGNAPVANPPAANQPAANPPAIALPAQANGANSPAQNNNNSPAPAPAAAANNPPAVGSIGANGVYTPAQNTGVGSSVNNALNANGNSPTVPNAPAGNIPAANAPAGNAPAANVPAANAPAGNAPAGSVPAANAPAANAPAGNVAAGNAPAGNAPAGNAPAANVPAGNAPAANVPAVNVPAGNAPAGNVAAGNAPAGNLPAGNAPAGNVVAGNAPAGNVAAANGPVQTINVVPIPASGSGNSVNGQNANSPQGQTPAGGQTPGQSGNINNNANVAALPPAVLSVGGQTYTAQPGQPFVLAGSTLLPSAPITVAGTPVSVLPGNTAILVGTQTQQLPTANAIPLSGQSPNSPAGNAAAITPAPIVFNGATIQPGPSSAYIISGQTLTPGAQITVDNTPISLASNGHYAAVGSSLQNLVPQSLGAQASPVVTFGGSTYTQGPNSNFVIAGQTITPGQPAVMVSGTPISIAPGASLAVIGSSTQSIAANPLATPPPLTIGGSTYTANAASQYIIGSQTLSAGGPGLTISGTPVSLFPGGSSALIASSTQFLSPASGTLQPALTVGLSTYFPTGSASAYIIGSQTLTPGGQIVVSGTTISLNANGATAVVGTSTENLVPATSATATASAAAAGSVFTVGGETFTANPSSFVVDGHTMTVGASATIAGTPVVLEPSGSLKIGSSEVPIGTGRSVAHSSSAAATAAAGPATTRIFSWWAVVGCVIILLSW